MLIISACRISVRWFCWSLYRMAGSEKHFFTIFLQLFFQIFSIFSQKNWKTYFGETSTFFRKYFNFFSKKLFTTKVQLFFYYSILISNILRKPCTEGGSRENMPNENVNEPIDETYRLSMEPQKLKTVDV